MPSASALSPHIPALLEYQAQRHPSKPALSVNDEAPLTFEGWWNRSGAASRLLRERIRPGEFVGLPFGSEHWCWFAEMYIACQLAGAVPVPAKPNLPESEWHRLIDGCRITHVITPAARKDIPVSVRAKTGVWTVEELQADSADCRPGPADPSRVNPVANVLHSSGTTGRPKAVAVTHEELLTGSELPVSWVGLTLVHIMSPASAAGIEGAMLLALKSAVHATVVVPAEVTDLMEKIRNPSTRIVLLPPSVALMCIRAGELTEPLTHPRIVMLMGSATPRQVLQRLAVAFPRAQVLTHYGATEAGAAQLVMPFDPRRSGAAGRPMGATEVRIVDSAGRPLGAGAQGEVLLRRRGVPRRRFIQTTASDPVVFDDDGWVHTGDLGYLDDDDFLYIVDRKKDIVVRGGQNIAPSEVENALITHPAVIDAAVFGVPHELWGEMLIAAVVLDRHAAVTASQLRRYLRGQLAPFKIPSRITFVSELPRNDLGKVEKTTLRRDQLAD